MIKNLKNQNYSDRFAVNQNIDSLLNASKDDEYRLGMVLYVSALQGNESNYYQALLTMQQKLNMLVEKDSTQNSYKSWRLGRILLAADSINDSVTIKTTLTTLKALLADQTTPKDAYSAWAFGYLAALNANEYKVYKNEMLSAAESLTERYNQAKTSETNAHEKLSDALWAWVMAIQAAANAHDEDTFNFILDKMKKITGQKTISLALSIGLKRLSESNDYPAWAISIVYLAAATLNNQIIYNELKRPLADSIQGAKETIQSPAEKISYGARAETTLAEVNSALAIIRMNEALSKKLPLQHLVSKL